MTAFRRRYVNTVRNSGASLHLQSVSKTNENFPSTPFTAVLLQSDTLSFTVLLIFGFTDFLITFGGQTDMLSGGFGSTYSRTFL